MGTIYNEYLLSLPSEIKRREAFYRQNYTENFIWIPAINGKEEKDKINLFDADRAEGWYRRKLSDGEKACTLSHIYIWKEFVENSKAKYAIICEDDALLSEDYPLIYQLLSENDDFSILVIGESKTESFLGNSRYHLAYPMQLQPKEYLYNGTIFEMGKIWKDFTCGTVGYVIHRQAAEALLSYFKKNKVFWLADDYAVLGSIIESTTLDSSMYIQHLYPRLAIEDNAHTSHIEEERAHLQQNQIRGIFRKTLHFSKRVLFAIIAGAFKIQRKKALLRWVQEVKNNAQICQAISKQKKISIIIPVYNGEGTIHSAIDSCLIDSYENLEVIIVDDASTDNTRAIIEKIEDDRIRYIYLQENVGTFTARRIGVEESSGEYILFLDADDELSENYLELLHRMPDVDLSIYQYKNMRTGSILPRIKHGVIYTDNIINGLLEFDLPFDWSTAGKVYERSILEKAYESLAFLNYRLVNAEDMLLFVAALLHTGCVVYVNCVIYQYNQSAGVRTYQTRATYEQAMNALVNLIKLIKKRNNKQSISFLKYAYHRLQFERWYASQRKREGRIYDLKYLINYIRFLGLKSLVKKIKQQILKV